MDVWDLTALTVEPRQPEVLHSDEGAARVREAYPGATWERLRAIKVRYDPTNLFRVNQNVRPGGRR